MYSRADIRLLSDEVAAVLDVDVVAAAGRHRRMCTFCTKNDTLQTVMQKMAWTAGMAGEALVCVGPDQRYEGLVSFTSLFGILESKSNPNTVTAPVSANPGAASSSIVEMEASTPERAEVAQTPEPASSSGGITPTPMDS
uniref:CBS domain-containing protein n=1 Tax=Lotharella oceanica TaxID=641309 RepID=A0A7S2X9G2_9EUKA|mmetsp:Transcript_20424/g.38429  ORF Transcript_20424/g.38429 Transcript_20424/m.38429 type:complete len:140 (+) Transcript_20424:62-481(+)